MTSTGYPLLSHLKIDGNSIFQHNTLNKLLIFSQVRLNLYVNIRINKVQTLNSTFISCIDYAKKLAQSHSEQHAASTGTARHDRQVDGKVSAGHGGGTRFAYRRLHSHLHLQFVRALAYILPRTHTRTLNSHDHHYYQLPNYITSRPQPFQILIINSSTTRRHRRGTLVTVQFTYKL